MAKKSASKKAAPKKAAPKKAAPKKAPAQKAATKPPRDDKSDYKNKQQAQKVQAPQNDGCLPKLFMFALPFLAVGAFLLSRAA